MHAVSCDWRKLCGLGYASYACSLFVQQCVLLCIFVVDANSSFVYRNGVYVLSLHAYV